MGNWKKKAGRVVDAFIRNFPIVNGLSVKDADELTKDPDNFNYRGNSWLKKMDEKWISRGKK
jgi:hypothetical protein